MDMAEVDPAADLVAEGLAAVATAGGSVASAVGARAVAGPEEVGSGAPGVPAQFDPSTSLRADSRDDRRSTCLRMRGEEWFRKN
ncbi:hypothetical protein SBA7_1040004 [Candidatus Sulfotelmatobacter sp. SbA7]|nr:hypothetical protein SBA7_1040004 [Candidatus Sulfotelmatobacter sp. SbA7]